MARKIFIAATGQNCGKTTASLSLLHLAQKKYQRVGFIKPLGPKPTLLNGVEADKDAALMAQVLDQEQNLRYMSPVVLRPGDTMKVLDGTLSIERFRQQILEACAELEKQCDLLIIEGAGHTGVGSILGMSNACIASMLEAPVLMVSGGGVGNVVDAVHLNLALFEQRGVEVRAVLTNKLVPEKRETTLRYLTQAFAKQPFSVIAGFNYQPILANPTLRRISRIFDLPIHGDQFAAERIIHHVEIGAASTQRVAELLQDSTLVIVTSSRDELLVTLTVLYQMEDFRAKIVGLLIPGTAPVGRITQRILDASKIPYLRTTNKSTAELYQMINDDVSKITAEDTEKIALVRKLAEYRFDFEKLDALFD